MCKKCKSLKLIQNISTYFYAKLWESCLKISRNGTTPIEKIH